MKVFIVSLALLLFSTHHRSNKSLIERIKIGKFSFLIYKEGFYSHDDDWHAEYFVVRKPGQLKELCSSYMTAKRNDSTFIEGRYRVFNGKLEFTECYYFSRNTVSLDSLKLTFIPTKNGTLRLAQTVEFKGGKSVVAFP
ncbi:hypothetical protein ACSBL2_11720 [Pedobacter sp. AW31-3R]|uniref:hypothetical protein n=1 Tax=Pedobacter sp. AW31-3R TaxID=3445781 RepID=UPI003FA0BBC6